MLLALVFAVLGSSSTAYGVTLQTYAIGAHAAVATDQHLASETGVRILREGGNAVDAAVAIGYTLAVTYPTAGNLGGGGFMLVRFADGRSRFIDFRETAPFAATPDMYLDSAGAVIEGLSTVGARSVGVPGSVAGLEHARELYGSRSRHELMRDAIDRAERGFILTDADAALLQNARPGFDAFPTTAAIFAPGGFAKAGMLFRQADLATTLRRVDTDGANGFYMGDVARELARSISAGGGIVTEADLAAYRVIDRDPLTCRYRGATVLTAPLPSSGGIAMCEIFGIVERDPAELPVRSFENTHLEVEAERRAFADRNTQLGDPAFVASTVSHLLSPAYLARQRASIASERATPSSDLHGGSVETREGTNTTNYSVIDAAGNAVDVTYTLNNAFGSNFVAGRTGVLLNDEMDDFTSKSGVPNAFGLVQGAANAIAPGKRPLSSMTPSIVIDSLGRPELVVGAAGGPRIITTTLDAIRAVVDFGDDAGEALSRPRIHMQWLPDVLYAENDAFDDATASRLHLAGYKIEIGRARSAANAVGIRQDGKRFGSHDPRVLAGAALAY
ncbi:MAG: gamma-glutamyltransferase [Candidatus Velthaea sp.]